MWKKTALFILIFILSTTATQAAGDITLDSYTQIVELEKKNSHHKITLTIDVASESREINLSLPLRTRNLKVLVDGEERQCKTDEMEGASILRCPFPEGVVGSHFIIMTFETAYPMFEIQNRIYYQSEYIPTYPTKNLDYILKLPLGYIIPEEKDISFFVNPEPKNIYSDGRRIILLWQDRNISRDYEVSALMEPAEAAPSLSKTAIAVLLLILVAAGVAYLLKRKEALKVSYPALVEHERIVVNLLKEAEDNVLWQKQIQHKTGFSKVKVSRIIRSLEERGVIKKEPWGNTNKIHLITDQEEGDSLYMVGKDVGESLLVEYRPTAKREEALVDMVDSLISEGKDVVIVSTQPSTSHYRERFKGVPRMRVINLPDQATTPEKDEIPMTNLEYFSKIFETLTKDHVFVFEPLSNLILHVGIDQAYRFASQAQSRLSALGATFIVFMNREGHDKKDVSNFENLFMNIAEIEGGKLKKVR
ncbi:MAG: helix-turn-helix transcriptional regulator [Candidatus Hydrothermarchaeales archaeon]